MQNKHTPGPWLISTIQGTDALMIGADDGSDVIADIRNRDENDTDANARLIAAAPDMLAALVQILESAQQHDQATGFFKPVCPYDLAAVCRAAIAKATGDAQDS